VNSDNVSLLWSTVLMATAVFPVDIILFPKEKSFWRKRSDLLMPNERPPIRTDGVFALPI
jgi:hypothetical protein